MSTNPYQSPSLLEDHEDSTADHGADELNIASQKRIAVGIRTAGIGMGLLTLVGFLPVFVVGLFRPLPLAFQSIYSALLLAFPITFVALVLVGIQHCGRVPGKHRALAVLATLLCLIGGIGVVGSLTRLLSAGRLLGLAPLFAASSCAGLLTGIALAAVYFRIWAKHCDSPRAALYLEGAVLLCALCGGAVSLSTLAPTLGLSVAQGLTTIGLFHLLPAGLLFSAGLYLLGRDWKTNIVCRPVAGPTIR